MHHLNSHIEHLDSRLLLTTLIRERSFGDDGGVKLSFGPTTVLHDSYPKADNMVVVAGGLEGDLLVVRLRANGRRDMNFGTNGWFRMSVSDMDDSVIKLEPRGGGWLLTTASNQQLRISAKGRFDRAFGIRPVLGSSDLPSGLSDTHDLGDHDGERLFVARSNTNGRYRLIRLTPTGQIVSNVELESLPLRDGPSGFENWTPEQNWTTSHFFLTSDAKVDVITTETEPWLANVHDYGRAKVYFWNLDGTHDQTHVTPNVFTINGGISQPVRRSDGSVLFLQVDGNDNHTRVGHLSADGSTFRDLGSLSVYDGPSLQSRYNGAISLSADRFVLAYGRETRNYSAEEATGGEAVTIIDIDTGEKQVLRVSPQDRLISSATTPWGTETHIIRRTGRVQLYTPAFANSANQFVVGTDGDDIIRINQASDRLVVNVNGKSRDIAATMYDSFHDVYGAPPTERLTLRIASGGGKDKIFFNASVPAHLLGGSGRDTIYGGSGDDTIEGNAGDDLIFANGGNDSIWAGAGFDNAFGGEGSDTILGGSENDFLDGQAGADAVYGEAGDDILIEYATGSIDSLFGGIGNDRAYHPENQDILDSIEGEFVPPT